MILCTVYEWLEAALVGLPSGDSVLPDSMQTLAARVQGGAVKRVHHCVEAGLQPDPWLPNAAVLFGSLDARVAQVNRTQEHCLLLIARHDRLEITEMPPHPHLNAVGTPHSPPESSPV